MDPFWRSSTNIKTKEEGWSCTYRSPICTPSFSSLFFECSNPILLQQVLSIVLTDYRCFRKGKILQTSGISKLLIYILMLTHQSCKLSWKYSLYDMKKMFLQILHGYTTVWWYNSYNSGSQSDFLRENDFRSDKGTITSNIFLIMPRSYMLFFTTGSILGLLDLTKNALHLLGGVLWASLLAEPMLALSAAAFAFASFSLFIHTT